MLFEKYFSRNFSFVTVLNLSIKIYRNIFLPEDKNVCDFNCWSNDPCSTGFRSSLTPILDRSATFKILLLNK